MDIYGHDSYAMLFDFSNPDIWPVAAIPTTFHALHEQQSPSTPYSLPEFQGGANDVWGGPVRAVNVSRNCANCLQGYANCASFLNEEFARVLYKNNFASGVALLNIYMIC